MIQCSFIPEIFCGGKKMAVTLERSILLIKKLIKVLFLRGLGSQ